MLLTIGWPWYLTRMGGCPGSLCRQHVPIVWGTALARSSTHTLIRSCSAYSCVSIRSSGWPLFQTTVILFILARGRSARYSPMSVLHAASHCRVLRCLILGISFTADSLSQYHVIYSLGYLSSAYVRDACCNASQLHSGGVDQASRRVSSDVFPSPSSV